MRQVEYANYYLPGLAGRKPYVSGWKLSAGDAASRGLTEADKVPGTSILREVPETEEERSRSQVNYPSAGHGGVKPPRSTK